MLNITSAQAIFSIIGIILFAYGLICCVLPKRRHFGILTLLLADAFFFVSIVYTKWIESLCENVGIDPVNFTTSNIYLGVGLGIVISAIWTLIRYGFLLLLSLVSRKTATSNEKSDDEQKNQQQEQDVERTQKHQRIEPSFSETTNNKNNSDKADPSLFKSLRYK